MATPAYLVHERTKGPARPSNAWIIYRKVKSQMLPPVAPGEKRRAQADVSKIISQMWKEEPEHVKAEYERRAEAEKARHRQQFPEYKFNPKSKAVKERQKAVEAAQKELKRANAKKARARAAAPYVVPVMVAPPSAHTAGVPINPSEADSPGAPSPLFSDSPSPASSKSVRQALPLPGQPIQMYPIHTPAHSLPSAESQQSQERPLPAPTMYAASMPPPQAHPDDITRPCLPYPHQYQPQNPPQHQQQEAYTSDLINWNLPPSRNDRVTLRGISSKDFTSYQTTSSSGKLNTDIYDATVFTTTDPSILALEGFDLDSLQLGSPGEPELSARLDENLQLDLDMEPFTQLASLLCEYDYPNVDALSSPQYTNSTSAGPSRTLSSAQAAVPPAFFTAVQETPFSHSLHQDAMSTQSFFNNGVEYSLTSSVVSPQQQHFHSYGQDPLEQFFNFDDFSSPLDHSTNDPPSHSQTISTMPYNSQSHDREPYTPPAAAAHNGVRRVGASWRTSPLQADAPVEQYSAETWPYPVSAHS